MLTALFQYNTMYPHLEMTGFQCTKNGPPPLKALRGGWATGQSTSRNPESNAQVTDRVARKQSSVTHFSYHHDQRLKNETTVLPLTCEHFSHASTSAKRQLSTVEVERGEGLWVPLTSQTSIYKGTHAWDSLHRVFLGKRSWCSRYGSQSPKWSPTILAFWY